jgi:hypothetical protein
MGVLVIFIVHMLVVVLQRFLSVQVNMAFGQM